jgi:hypothetical protein
MPFDDSHIEWLIIHVREWVSLPKQRQTLRSATNYEFTRARRVIHVALGIFKRGARRVPMDQRTALEELGRGAVIAFGRPALLPLILVLRARSNNSWVKMTACPPQVRFYGKSGWIFEQRNQLI